MNCVKLLTEQVANQIAAGEVVERPASVVKELVENALDAKASRITVEIGGGGRTLIRVSDDGVGMSQDDALMSLERHATSKIRKAEDLAQIDTMGFRGEAIPSIASVSRMTIMSREREAESPEGTEINISGGKILAVKVAGVSQGTSVEVRNLFFNLPARRKFLKSDETERSHIQHYIMLVAMAYPHLGLTYIQEGRTVFQFPPSPFSAQVDLKLLRERMRLLYGAGEELVNVESSLNYDSTPEEDVALGAPSQVIPLKLWGLMGAPGVSRSTRDRQHFFVNRRPVENRGLNYALSEAYQNALMKGRYPVCCLFLELDPAEVDVNIHPAKREVKFHKERAVQRIVSHILRTALEDYHGLSVAQSATDHLVSPLLEGVHPSGSMGEPHPTHPVASHLEETLPELAPPYLPLSDYPARPLIRLSEPEPSALPQPVPSENIPLPSREKGLGPDAQPVSLNSPLLSVPLRFLGVLNKLYLLFESDRGLVLVDQHAAHERVLFERLMSQMARGVAESQQLLLSETIELGMRDAVLVREKIESFNHLGIGLHEFGQKTFLIDALPPFVKGISPKKFILDLLDELRATGRELNQADLIEEAIAAHSCRLAVKAHDTMEQTEIDRLMDDLRHCKMPYTCPHGRPTIIEISGHELEKKFRRIV